MVDPLITGAVAKVDEQLSPAAQKFAEGVVGKPSSELGEMWADRIRLRRWKASYKLWEKAARFAEERGLDPSEVPVKTLFPLLEKATLEDPDDEPLMERWANLLVGYAEPENGIPPSFPDILSQLSPLEARLLDAIYHGCTDIPREDWWKRGVQFTAIVEGSPEERTAVRVAVENLYRLGLSAPPTTGTSGAGDENSGRFAGSHSTNRSCLTELGYAFVNACRGPEDVRVPPPVASNEPGVAVFESSDA